MTKIAMIFIRDADFLYVSLGKFSNYITWLRQHYCVSVTSESRGHSGRVVTLSPPTSEVGVRFPALPQVGKLVVACHWSAVYSTEP